MHHNLKLYFIAFILLGSFSLSAQEREMISLEEVLLLAQGRSLEAYRAKRQYAQEYWQFRSFRASLLPSVTLETEPLSYNRSFVERYDQDRNIDVFRQQQNLSTYANLSLNQNILWTGASVYLNSSFERLVNYGENRIQSYNTTPIRLGIIQPIMAFNRFKWQKKTADLELEKAKNELVANQQKINQRVISLFFQWALAYSKLEIARENKETTKRLYEIGKKRYDLGSIEKDDLLNLELDSFTSVNGLTRAEQDLETIISDLKTFLNMGELPAKTPELPELISKLKIDIEEALQLAEENNPDLLNTQIQRIHAERDLDQVVKDNRFDLSVNASFGLNQQANHIRNAYGRLLDQQMIGIRFSIPLLDWGERKGNIQKAKMTKEVQDIQVEQDRNDIVRRLKLAVTNFNLQEEQVLTALRSRDIARESYEVTEKRFLSGKVDLLRLTSSRKAWQSSTDEYIRSLQQYWEYYYEVQELTLFNFLQKMKLGQDFDRIIEES